jgi:hypothetical protein
VKNTNLHPSTEDVMEFAVTVLDEAFGVSVLALMGEPELTHPLHTPTIPTMPSPAVCVTVNAPSAPTHRFHATVARRPAVLSPSWMIVHPAGNDSATLSCVATAQSIISSVCVVGGVIVISPLAA